MTYKEIRETKAGGEKILPAYLKSVSTDSVSESESPTHHKVTTRIYQQYLLGHGVA